MPRRRSRLVFLVLFRSQDVKLGVGTDKLFAAVRSVLRPSDHRWIDNRNRWRTDAAAAAAGHFIREKTHHESQTKAAVSFYGKIGLHRAAGGRGWARQIRIWEDRSPKSPFWIRLTKNRVSKSELRCCDATDATGPLWHFALPESSSRPMCHHSSDRPRITPRPSICIKW